MQTAHKWECENNGKYNKNLEAYVMNKKWVVIILSLALIMLIMPQNITAEDNSVNYDNLIIVSDDIVSKMEANPRKHFGSTVCFEVAPDNYLSRKFIEAEI